MVDHGRVVRRRHDGPVPVPAVAHVLGIHAELELRVRLHAARGPEFGVQLADHPLNRGRVEEARVVGVERDPGRLPAPRVEPVLPAQPAGVRRPAQHRHARVVLLAAVKPVRELVVHREPVDLRGGLVLLRRPGLSPVEGDRSSPVVRGEHGLVVERVDPQVVVVHMRRLDRLPGAAAVDRPEEGRVQSHRRSHDPAGRRRSRRSTRPGRAARVPNSSAPTSCRHRRTGTPRPHPRRPRSGPIAGRGPPGTHRSPSSPSSRGGPG